MLAAAPRLGVWATPGADLGAHTHCLYWEGGLAQGGSASASGSVWVLDFVQERFHSMSLGGFEGMFIEADNLFWQ